MKVLFTADLFPPDIVGGGEVICYNIVKRLVKTGVDVTVLCSGNPKQKSYDGIKTIRIPVHRYLLNFAVPIIYKHAQDADLIHAANYNTSFPSWFVGKVLKKPTVCLIQGAYAFRWHKIKGPIFGRIAEISEKIMFDRSYDKILFLSEFSRQIGVKDLGINKNITDVILPGVDRKKFKPGKKKPFVLFVGRLAKQKGVCQLMEAARILKDVRFVLIGSGEEEKQLKEIAPPNVEFLGFKTHDEIRKWYSEALIFCLPSVGEGFGIVLLEAMASGCAVVSTVPIDYSGIKLNTNNVKEIVAAIRKLLKDKNKTKNLGERNREKSKNYDWDKSAKKLVKIYKQVLKL